MPDTPLDTSRGQTPAEVARYLRVSADRVRDWIRRGEMEAIDTGRHRCGRPRWIVLPHHLAGWERRHRAATPPATPRRRRLPPPKVDYFPD